MIQVRGLVKRFGSFEALHAIDLTVHEGEIYGFLGHNGAGKSTTMNILAGLSRPDAGTVRVAGRSFTDGGATGAGLLGYLPEDPRFYDWMSAREALAFYLDPSGPFGADPGERIETILDWIGLADAAKRRIGGYSRGMKQRLGLGIALLNDPALLLLDEPSSALDPQGRLDVLRLILDLKKMGKTVFLSTHILADAERVCDRLSILTRGRIVREDTLGALLAQSVRPHVQVRFSHPPEADALGALIRVLGADASIERAQADGGHLEVALADETRGKRALLGALASSPVEIAALEQRTSTLEDIFIQEVNGHVG